MIHNRSSLFKLITTLVQSSRPRREALLSLVGLILHAISGTWDLRLRQSELRLRGRTLSFLRCRVLILLRTGVSVGVGVLRCGECGGEGIRLRVDRGVGTEVGVLEGLSGRDALSGIELQ